MAERTEERLKALSRYQRRGFVAKFYRHDQSLERLSVEDLDSRPFRGEGEMGTELSPSTLMMVYRNWGFAGEETTSLQNPSIEEVVSFLESLRQPFDWLGKLVFEHTDTSRLRKGEFTGAAIPDSHPDQFAQDLVRVSYLTVRLIDETRIKVGGVLKRGYELERFGRFVGFLHFARNSNIPDFASLYRD